MYTLCRFIVLYGVYHHLSYSIAVYTIFRVPSDDMAPESADSEAPPFFFFANVGGRRGVLLVVFLRRRTWRRRERQEEEEEEEDIIILFSLLCFGVAARWLLVERQTTKTTHKGPPLVDNRTT